MERAKRIISDLLSKADIQINGDRPEDIQIHNKNFYERVLQEGSLGLGESYMNGWWDCKNLDRFFTKILEAKLHEKVKKSIPALWEFAKSIFLNKQNSDRAHIVGEHHYDIGNDLYEAMLDRRMVYTTGFWENSDGLDEAQEHKLQRVCETLNIKKGQKILDIGCGWGSFAEYAAQNFDARIVGITVSEEQKKYAEERCRDLDVEIRLQDYRELNEPFDGIVSLGMFEHVGFKNYRTFMRVAHRCLKKEGRFILHTIGGSKSVHDTDPWIEKYIFPNSMVPSIRQIGLALEELFIMEEWVNHGPDYDKTLMAWYQNFANNWDNLKDDYSERFFRMWEYYLLASAGSFRARKNHQWEIILTGY